MSVGNNIKNLRLEHHFSQEELASKLYVTRNAISKWENDRSIPSVDNLKEISRIFNVSLDRLLDNESLIEITLDNKKNALIIKHYIYAIVLCFTYTTIGILIPYLVVQLNPYSLDALFVLFLPMIYVILGIICALFMHNWRHVIVSSILALIPIYMFFESILPNTILGFRGIIYLLIFYIAYFLTSIVRGKDIYINNQSVIFKVFAYASLFLTIIFIIDSTIACITLYRCVYCSAPWHTALILNSIYYAVPLLFLYLMTYYFYHKKRN